MQQAFSAIRALSHQDFVAIKLGGGSGFSNLLGAGISLHRCVGGGEGMEGMVYNGTYGMCNFLKVASKKFQNHQI